MFHINEESCNEFPCPHACREIEALLGQRIEASLGQKIELSRCSLLTNVEHRSIQMLRIKEESFNDFPFPLVLPED